MPINPKVSVNGVCFPRASVLELVALWREIEAQTVAIVAQKLQAEGWDESLDLLRDSKLNFAALIQGWALRLDQERDWDRRQQEFCRTIDAAAALGAPQVYTTSGSRGTLDWTEAAQVFSTVMRPVVDYASAKEIRLLLEPTVTLRADVSFVHTLGDAANLAEQAGFGVCLDIFHCWTDSDLKESIGRVISNCGLIQVSDFVVGDVSLPARAVPGDGDIPLERIMGWILDAGYQGIFDLELNGPRIDAEGEKKAVRRAAQWVGDILRA